MVRYVGLRKLRDNGRPDADAFRLRPEEEGLSFNLLDSSSQLTKEQQIAAVKQVAHYATGTQGKFAELNVGQLMERLTSELPEVSIIHSPVPASDRFPYDDLTHCQVMGLPQHDSPESQRIGEIIARCVTQLHPVV